MALFSVMPTIENLLLVVHLGEAEQGTNGEGGIRTHGTFRYTRFQVERIRPLCHLSKGDIKNAASIFNRLGYISLIHPIPSSAASS